MKEAYVFPFVLFDLTFNEDKVEEIIEEYVQIIYHTYREEYNG